MHRHYTTIKQRKNIYVTIDHDIRKVVYHEKHSKLISLDWSGVISDKCHILQPFVSKEYPYIDITDTTKIIKTQNGM